MEVKIEFEPADALGIKDALLCPVCHGHNIQLRGVEGLRDGKTVGFCKLVFQCMDCGCVRCDKYKDCKKDKDVFRCSFRSNNYHRLCVYTDDKNDFSSIEWDL